MRVAATVSHSLEALTKLRTSCSGIPMVETSRYVWLLAIVIKTLLVVDRRL